MSDVPSYPADAAEREATTTSAERDYAGWGRRVGAYILDSLLLGVIVFVAALIVGLLVGLGSDSDAGVGAAVVVGYILSFLLPFVYFSYFHSRTGQTPGKRWLGIRVVGEADGEVLSFGRAFGRYAITFLFGIFVIPVVIDYLWPLWDSKNQALHDKVVSSLVVRA